MAQIMGNPIAELAQRFQAQTTALQSHFQKREQNKHVLRCVASPFVEPVVCILTNNPLVRLLSRLPSCRRDRAPPTIVVPPRHGRSSKLAVRLWQCRANFWPGAVYDEVLSSCSARNSRMQFIACG